jgi:fructose-bisphosphate aldolase, class II
MALVSMTHLLTEARAGRYAVSYCESWNLESFVGVVEAAEELDAPIVTGFNGGFLGHSGRSKPEDIAYYAGMGLALRDAALRAAFILNETDDLAQIERAVGMGFNAVMVENEHLRPTPYRSLVKKVVALAHPAGVAVEAAVGRLADGAGHVNAEATSPSEAQSFVEETGIDALSVAVGNVHILTEGKAAIDLEMLDKIRNRVKVPLVLHGGTGIPMERMPDYIQRGVAKINFGTALKQAYLDAIRQKLAMYQRPMSPHPFIGMGGREDILMAGREAVKQKARELITLCGSAGKASQAGRSKDTRT